MKLYKFSRKLYIDSLTTLFPYVLRKYYTRSKGTIVGINYLHLLWKSVHIKNDKQNNSAIFVRKYKQSARVYDTGHKWKNDSVHDLWILYFRISEYIKSSNPFAYAKLYLLR